VKTARELLDWDVPVIVTGVDCSDIFIALAGAENAEGVVSVVFGHQAYESDLPGVQKYEKIWEEFGPPESQQLRPCRMTVAEATVWSLGDAGPELRGSFLDAGIVWRQLHDLRRRGPGAQPPDHRLSEVEQINMSGRQVGCRRRHCKLQGTTDCTPRTPPAGFGST
jgi:hypothetical protein